MRATVVKGSEAGVAAIVPVGEVASCWELPWRTL